MPTKEKRKLFLKDEVASIIFTDEDCRDYVIKVVSKALELEEDIIRENLRLITPRVNVNASTKYSTVDAIYGNDTSIINIEINSRKSKQANEKNMRYVCQLLLRQTMKGKKKIPLKPIYQININQYDYFNEGKFIYRSEILETSIHKRRDDFITIIDINVDFLSNISYNDIKEGKNSLEYLLYIFVNNNKNELDKLYLNDEIMDEVRDKLDILEENFDYLLYYDREELKKEALYEEGFDNGVKSNSIKIAKAMLKDDVPIETITKYTNLTKEDIERLQQSN